MVYFHHLEASGFILPLILLFPYSSHLYWHSLKIIHKTKKWIMNANHNATYNTWWKVIVMFWSIGAPLGKNLRSNGTTTCSYQSSTFVTSNSGLCWGTDVLPGRYASASSARVQLSRNWVRVALLICDTSLWRQAGVIHQHQSVYDQCIYVYVCVREWQFVPHVWRTQIHEQSSRMFWKPPWTRLQPVSVMRWGSVKFIV